MNRKGNVFLNMCNLSCILCGYYVFTARNTIHKCNIYFLTTPKMFLVIFAHGCNDNLFTTTKLQIWGNFLSPIFDRSIY